jgi:hypothetical protein
MSESLDQYLQATLSEGHIESSGQFSISLPQLLEKLGSQSLYHWANYSLFAIRGLVKLGCQAIHISQSKHEIWIVGHRDDSCPELSELDSLLPDQILSGQTGMALLARASACLVHQNVDQVMMARWLDTAETTVLNFCPTTNVPKLGPTVKREGFSLGLYAHFTSSQKFCDLEEHLAYAVQYCPIPVMLHKVGWWTSVNDLRIHHWLDQKPAATAHPAEGLAKVEIPLCCDIYQGPSKANGQGLLLKPCGGMSHAHYAACCDSKDFDWLQTAWSTDSVSALGRYFQLEHDEIGIGGLREQRLVWSATKHYANSVWGERGKRKAAVTSLPGESILLLSQKFEEDQVVPVLDGVTLNAIKGQLRIPGLTLIVSPPADLALDLGGQNIVQSQTYLDWLSALRRQTQQAMARALEHPLSPPIVSSQPSALKTCAVTGALCLAGAVLWDGPQISDLIGFTHGGVFGGMLTSIGLRVGRRFLPKSWQDAEKRTFLGRIQRCHDDTVKALETPGN